MGEAELEKSSPLKGYQLWLADSPEQVAQLAARYVAIRLRIWLNSSPRAMLLLSGGRSPIRLLETLTQTPIDWSKVVVSLADERWVSNGHPDSNQRLLEEHLLQHLPQSTQFIPLYRADCSPEDATELLEQDFLPLKTAPALAILGMGDDGHTASLFPDSADYELAMSGKSDWYPVDPGIAPHRRITASFNRLLSCSERLLYLPSLEKRARFHELLDGTVRSPIVELVKRGSKPLQVFSVYTKDGSRI